MPDNASANEEKPAVPKDENRGIKKFNEILNSITDFTDGFGKTFDFSKEHNSGTKFLNIMGVTGLDIAWVIIVSVFLIAVLGFTINEISTLLNPIYFNAIQRAFSATIGRSPFFTFFFACIMAPLWETLVFQVFPLRLALFFTDGKGEKTRNSFVWLFAIFASIIFGLGHFGVISILIQGVGGMLYCWLYLRNNLSYWSPVVAHSIWNFIMIFGLQILIHS